MIRLGDGADSFGPPANPRQDRPLRRRRHRTGDRRGRNTRNRPHPRSAAGPASRLRPPSSTCPPRFGWIGCGESPGTGELEPLKHRLHGPTRNAGPPTGRGAAGVCRPVAQRTSGAKYKQPRDACTRDPRGSEPRRPERYGSGVVTQALCTSPNPAAGWCGHSRSGRRRHSRRWRAWRCRGHWPPRAPGRRGR